MTDGSLMIDSVRLGMEAATSFDRAERTSERVREAIRAGLPSALAEACHRDLQGDGHIFVDRLEVESQVATHWNDDRIAAMVGQQIGAALARKLDLGGALIFRDRPELVGAYAMSIVDSPATKPWWFAEFGGLDVLPVSARLRTLLAAEGRHGFEALARLSASQRMKAVRALDDADIKRLLRDLPAGPCPFSPSVIVDAIEAREAEAAPSKAHEVLSMIVHLFAGPSGTATRETVQRLELIQALVEAGRCGRLASVDLDHAQPILRRWTELIGRDPAIAAGLDEAADRIVDYVTARAAEPEHCFQHTRFGGAFLLLGVLVRSGWWAAWQSELAKVVEDTGAERLASALALAVVAKALDGRSCRAIEADRALQQIIYPAETRIARLSRSEKKCIADALGRAAPTEPICSSATGFGERVRICSLALLEAFASRVPGCDGSSSGYVRRNLLSLHASVSADGTSVRLGCPPLDVLLTLSGLK